MTQSSDKRPIEHASVALTSEIQLAYKRSRVRRWVTYWLTLAYIALALLLIGLFLWQGLFKAATPELGSQFLQTGLAIFSGVSVAALSVIGYWFGNRNVAADQSSVESLSSASGDQTGGAVPPRVANRGDDGVVHDTSSEKIENAYRKAVGRFGGIAGVTGIDKGFKYQNGVRSDHIVIRIHVQEKKPSTKLPEGEMVPAEIDGVPTDVIEGHGAIQEAQLNPTTGERLATLSPGIGIRALQAGARPGTLGLFVFRKNEETGRSETCLLSCAHVLFGRDREPVPHTKTAQPTTSDEQNDVVADLLSGFINRQGDAAIARLTGARAASTALFGTDLVLTSARMPKCGDTLEKIGWSTARTEGLVDGEGCFAIGSNGTMVRSFRIVPTDKGRSDGLDLSQGGDSGAVWFDPVTRAAVGLHFMGNGPIHPEAAYACFMPIVLRELKVSIVAPTA